MRAIAAAAVPDDGGIVCAFKFLARIANGQPHRNRALIDWRMSEPREFSACVRSNLARAYSHCYSGSAVATTTGYKWAQSPGQIQVVSSIGSATKHDENPMYGALR